MTTEKDETFTILVKGKPLASVKADLIHAFLSVRYHFFSSIYKVACGTNLKQLNFR